LIYYPIPLLVITITGYVIISVYKHQEVSRKEISDSKINESLQRDSVTTIINNLTDAILSADINGIIRTYNAASLNLLDTNVSLSGKYVDEILPLVD